MKQWCLIAPWLLLFGCSEPPPAYSPASFRATITELVKAKKYVVAVAYVRSADPERQAAFDKDGYCAIGEDAIVLPGAPSTALYERTRDWFMPGTSDAIENVKWQRAATEFATAYNRHRK
jgi:hypothetical protein